MKTSTLTIVLLFFALIQSEAFNSQDSTNIIGLWTAEIKGTEEGYRFMEKMNADGKTGYSFLDVQKKFNMFLLIDSNMEGGIFIKFKDNDSTFVNIASLGEKNYQPVFNFTQCTLKIISISEKQLSTKLTIKLDSLDEIECYPVALKLSDYKTGITTFRGLVNQKTSFEISSTNSIKGFLNIQSENLDMFNFRISFDVMGIHSMNEGLFYSTTFMNLAREKLDNGESMYSTNYFLWGSFLLEEIINEILSGDSKSGTHKFLVTTLLILNIPNLLLNSQLNFPIYSRKDYLGINVGIKTDWYFFAHDNAGDFCFDPKIGLTYLFNKKIGFELNGNYPLWTNGENILKNSPYIGLNLNILP